MMAGTTIAPAVIDCILNAEILRHAGLYRPLKYFLVQLVMGWAQQKVRGGVQAGGRHSATRFRMLLQGSRVVDVHFVLSGCVVPACILFLFRALRTLN